MIAIRPRFARLATLAGYAALGPITGPLTAGVIRNLRNGAPGLAGLYVLAWALIYLDLMAFAAQTAGRALTP